MNYSSFIDRKSQLGTFDGFDPVWMPDFLYDFQQALVEWAIRKGRAAIFADCGLGKTPMQLVWAENIVRKTGKRVLVLTPLAVSHQTINEAKKFGIEAHRSRTGDDLRPGINVTNYEQLDRFSREDFIGVVCDESSILKSFDGATRGKITEFSRKMPYRLLATATAAPNDYIELGTSSEALGELGAMDMLNRFFKNDQNNSAVGRKYGEVIKWRLKGHAEVPFWRWVCSWARAIRKPSDLGFNDGKFILPPLIERTFVVEAQTKRNGMLFEVPAIGLAEQREERRRTIRERCEKVSELVSGIEGQSLVWCHLNSEGDLLEELIRDAEQISGSDSDERKEELFMAFASGELKVLVTKPKIGAWGLNFQRCAHVTFFPSHSFEQYYQGVRRCWRFGQVRPVEVDTVMTKGERAVMDNLRRKAGAADLMFTRLVEQMNNTLRIEGGLKFDKKEEVPSWL
jgi:SNF2 family DNA or RNA helicase